MVKQFPSHSDILLGSAEKLAASGVTNEEIRRRTRLVGADLARKNILLIDLNDSTITISQYDRAIRLIREIYHDVGQEGKSP